MDEIAKRFADLAAQYGPQVADAAKAAVRTEAYSMLVGSIIWAFVAVATLWVACFLWRKGAATEDDIPYIASCVCVCIGLGCGLVALWTWIDPWTWTALNHPELWIAKKAFHI